ncbi:MULTISPECIES: hypothetical protein [Streptosporangiaceae]|uniref:hypothetical protein n=1 Tax=Streptosporangiaceae TaxID=2004 RepID=UPI0034059BC5
MKAKDIKSGVVYAHQRGRGEYASVRPVVFLAHADSDHLYSTTSHHRPKGSPAFQKATYPGAKPKRGQGYSASDVGYPIATGPADKLAEVTLADFEAAASHYHAHGVEFNVLTSLTSVVGPYEEVFAEQKKRLQDTEEAHDRERERKRAHSARLDAQQKRLRDLGVGSTQSSVLTGPDMLAISADDVDKLLALLSTSTEET